MFRLRDISIRRKLNAQVIGYTILVTGVLILAGNLIRIYRVHGPVFNQIADDLRLLEDIELPAMSMNSAYLMLQEIDSLSDPDEIGRTRERFLYFEKRYHERRSFWLAKLPNDEIRRMLEENANPPADEFLRIANADYLPLIDKGPENRKKANEVLRTKIRPLYWRHREATVDVVKKVQNKIQEDEQEARDSSEFWNKVMAAVSIALVTVMGATGFWIGNAISRSARELNGRVQEMSGGAGDLTARIKPDGEDEMGQLAVGINAVIGKIQAIVLKVREASLQLLSVASEIAATARSQEQNVQDLSASVTQVATSVREISATSQDLAGTMSEVNRSATHTAELATKGRDNTNRMAEEMKQLVDSTASVLAKLSMIREKADRINAVITTITKVADQTNLLSINAAIEAEKAGEYGRGFLVVAREIRRLADQTAVATLDIETMVRQMQDAVSAGVMQMDKFADEVRSGVGQVTAINQMTLEIITEVQALSGRFQLVTEGMRNQAVGAQQINDAMAQIAESARRSAQSVQEFERATTHLRSSVEGVNQEIGQFKV